MSGRDFIRTNLIAATLSSTHFSVRTVLPMILASLGEAYGLGEGRIGDLGSAYGVGATGIALGSGLWLRQGRLRLPSVMLSALGLAALAAVALVSSYPMLLGLFLLGGIGFGGVYALMIVLLGQTEDPNRAFGWQWSLGAIPGMALLYLIPLVAPSGAAVGAIVALIVFANLLTSLPALWLGTRLPRAVGASPGHGAASAAVPPARWPALLGAFGLFAIYAGVTGVWSFLGRIAAGESLDRAHAGLGLALATLAAVVASFAAGESGRAGARPVTFTAALALAFGGFAALAWWTGAWGYSVGAILLIGFASYALTLCTAVVSRLDAHGPGLGLTASALGAGAILGPSLAGHVFEARGLSAMYLVCLVLVAFSGLAYGLVYPRALRHA